MDQNQSSKKQRNPKGQRDRRRGKDKEVEAPSPAESQEPNTTSDPQPQRANRRQRNEPPPATSSGEKPAPVAEEKKEKDVVVDHSYLKRETEEIAKLKKKYTKREIESNWHRYVAEECVPKADDVEEDAAADFSELVQASVSKGAHLQLKEEQDWATVSGNELGGYFTLDLRVLAQGLECVPLHERLRLPTHVLNEEEIRHLNVLAEHGKQCYKPETDNRTTTFFKTLTSLIAHDTDVEDPSSSDIKAQVTEKPFNILDIEGSNNILLNIGDDMNPTDVNESSTHVLNDDIGKELSNDIKFSIPHNNSMSTEKDVKDNRNPTINDTNIFDNKEKTSEKSDKNYENVDIVLDVPKQKEEDVTRHKLPEKETIIHQAQVTEKVVQSQESYKKLEEKPVASKKEPAQILENHNTNKKEMIDNNNADFIVKTESKEQRTSRNKLKPTKGESDEFDIAKESQTTKETTLEDDDDLDFLLSLKTPLPVTPKKESTTIKESSFIPGGPVVSQPMKTDEPSALDDWLDSVLQD